MTTYTPTNREKARRWNNSQLLAVSLAIDHDSGYSANLGIECPVCHEPTLDYEEVTMIDVVAWCRTCKTGYQQGNPRKTQKRRS